MKKKQLKIQQNTGQFGEPTDFDEEDHEELEQQNKIIDTIFLYYKTFGILPPLKTNIDCEVCDWCWVERIVFHLDGTIEILVNFCTMPYR